MANGRIYSRYEREGYFSVPGYYNTEGKDNHCKVCREWENRSAIAGTCSDCDYMYRREHKANKTIAGIPVRAMSREQWQVFQAIATQIIAHETPFATVEEYAEECRADIEAAERARNTKSPEQQQRDAILYS